MPKATKPSSPRRESLTKDKNNDGRLYCETF